ncbi:hypothetical protein H5410_016950 [Solanum commersonii]|uniref:Uncharacterized protein n=1 Tax=Solanum commersonii TaxID=4109 RepID=A0A9J5ZXQ6_SOLCO|nr:hypothetical protein H5410_016950 [Solanum commersonii]
MWRHTKRDKMRNKVIWEKVEVAFVARRQYYKGERDWNSLDMCRGDAPMSQARPKKYWEEVIRHGMGGTSYYRGHDFRSEGAEVAY